MASAVTGTFLCLREKYRLQDIQMLQRAILLLKGEISYLAAPLAEALESVSYKISGEIGDVLQKVSKQLQQRKEQTAEEIWTTVWQREAKRMYLSAEDVQMVLEFGKTLGYLDKQQQENSMQRLLFDLEQIEKRVTQRLQKNGKLYYSMGILCGLLLIVVLL